VTADGELPGPISVAKLTPSVKRPLILQVPAEGPGAKTPFRAAVFEEYPAKFPFGSFMFQNFSPQNVTAEMGGETFVVKPGSEGRLIKNRRILTVSASPSKTAATRIGGKSTTALSRTTRTGAPSSPSSRPQKTAPPAPSSAPSSKVKPHGTPPWIPGGKTNPRRRTPEPPVLPVFYLAPDKQLPIP